ncbi:MAG: alpha/beta hydrolase [Rhodospirillales bacterium]|nr:alpha/beta hydrolase [Rhodospirillales bacterium]
MRAIRATLLLCLLAVALPARAAPVPGSDLFFHTSDGVRLHAIVAGATSGPTIVLIPGWTMPAWIFAHQIRAFSAHYRVVALDPRGQGRSDVARTGYNDQRRGQDIAELLALLGPRPVLLGGWSLGVLDVLAYVHTHGDARVAGLLLVDNSVGERPWPTASPPRPGTPPPWPVFMRGFVRSMFLRPQSPAYLERLTRATLVTPQWAAEELLRYPEPPSYWRDALYGTQKPALYVVRPWLAAQAANVARHDPRVETAVMQGVGHAMFVDAPHRFDALLLSFLQRKIWPR